MLTRFLPKFTRHQSLYLFFGALILSAWTLLIAWQGSPFAERLGHEMLGHQHVSFVSQLGVFLLGWLLMTIAMMLPASLPMLLQAHRPSTRANLWIMGLVLGYLTPWILFGLLAFLGDSFLHELAEEGAPLAAASPMIAPVIILAAGIYQLTPFKRTFNQKCKPAFNVDLSAHALQGGSSLGQGMRMGLDCMGSCWALMLLMFALGHHRLDWMVVMAAIMAAERLTPWGSQLAKWVGVGLMIWGVVSITIIL